jgi:hypothetical protein
MANTTSTLGRLQAVHPDLGFDGGVTLEGHVKSTLTKISDAINSRFFVSRLLLDSTSVNFEHNFKCAFSELRINLFLIDGGDELTRITEATTPPLSDFSIVAKVGDLTTHITVTNNTGSTQDIALVVVQGKGAEVLSDLGDCDTTGKEDGQALVYSVGSGKFIPGASGDSSFKFQKLTGTVLTIKKGYLILSTGEEIYSSADLSPDLATAIPGADGNYYGYFDRTTFPAASTVSGRKLIAMTTAQLVFLTTTPDQINLSRYVPIGKVIKSTGVFSGLETLAMRRHGLEAGLRIKSYTGTALNGLTALPGVHYIVDMSGVSADKGFVLPAGADLSRVRVSIIPPSSLYKFSVTANGAETFVYGGQTGLTAIDFPAGAETWAEFCWNGTAWAVEDATTPISGTFSGDLVVTGTLTPQGGIFGKTNGVAVAAGYVGEESATVNANAAANSYATIASKTLGVGSWLVSVGYYGAGGASGQHAAKLNIKGTAGSVQGDTLMEAPITSTAACSFSFPLRVVTIASGDADKTVTVTAAATSNYTGYASIHAIRLP